MSFKFLVAVIFLGMTSNASAQSGFGKEVIKLNETCQVNEGKFVAYDFPNQFKFGEISNSEKITGAANLVITRTPIEGSTEPLWNVTLTKNDGGHKVTSISAIDGMLGRKKIVFSSGDVSIYLSKRSKNEWYGTIQEAQLQKDSLAHFIYPISCSFKTHGITKSR